MTVPTTLAQYTLTIQDYKPQERNNQGGSINSIIKGKICGHMGDPEIALGNERTLEDLVHTALAKVGLHAQAIRRATDELQSPLDFFYVVPGHGTIRRHREHLLGAYARDPKHPRALGQHHHHQTQPGDVREGLSVPQVPAPHQPVLLQQGEDQAQLDPHERPGNRPIRQVREAQLEAAPSTADSTMHTANAANDREPPQRAEGARMGPEKTPGEPQDRGYGPTDATARPRMCMRLRGGGQSEVLRVISKNVDGVSSVARFNTLCQQIKKEHAHKPILAVCLQEHHLTREQLLETQAHLKARQAGLLYVQANRPTSTTKGGAGLIIPHDSIETRPGESTDAAIARVATSAYRRDDGRHVTVDTLLDGKPLRIASIYAPVDHTERAQFYTDIKPQLNDATIIGADSNCVLNTAIDLDGASPTTVTNLSKGATEYLNILTDYDLTDVIRESIGNDAKLFTNHTHVAGGSVTRTRIDHIHAPQIDAIIWKYIPAAPDFLTFQRTFGHDMIQIEARIVRPERGRDLTTMFDDADFNDELATLIKNTMTDKNPDAHGWGAAWEATKAVIRTRCIAQTKTLRRQEEEETARLKAELSFVEATIKGAGTHTPTHRPTRPEMNSKNNSPNDHAPDAPSTTCSKRKPTRTAGNTMSTRPPSTAPMDTQELGTMGRRAREPRLDRPLQSPEPATPGEADKETDHSKIAAAFTKYYAPLYANKPVDQQAKAKALKTLRKGSRVLPPTAAKSATPTSPKKKSSTPRHTTRPARAQDPTAYPEQALQNPISGHRPNPHQRVQREPTQRRTPRRHALRHHQRPLQEEGPQRPTQLPTPHAPQ